MANGVEPGETPPPETLEQDEIGEHALAASEAQLRMALDATHTGTFDWDLASGTLRWNANHAEILGLDLDQFAGVLAAEHPGEETFATVCCGWVPPSRDQATFVVAGHPPPLLLSDHAEGIDLPSGPPLGLGTEWTGTTIPLPPAWTLLLYTDGLTEARSGPRPGSDRFGEHGLLAHLGAQPEPASLDGSGLDNLLAHVQRLSGERFADDVAVLLVRHHPDPDTAADQGGR